MGRDKTNTGYGGSKSDKRRRSSWPSIIPGFIRQERSEGDSFGFAPASGECGGFMETIGEKDFQKRVEASGTPVLLCFYSQKCKPCSIMAPDIEELEKEYSSTVEFLRVDTSVDTELATRLSVVSTPTLILFVDGAPVLRMVGYVTKTDIRQKVDEQLKISAK